MTDYLKVYEKFKLTKEVGDYINDVLLLRHYHDTQQFSQMMDHIHKMMDKYFIETLLWNCVNTVQPTTIEQSYLNAEQFLKLQGAKLFIGMDSANIRNMLRVFGGDPAGKVHKLMDYTARGGDVADPWYSERFDVAYRDIYEGCTALLDAILKQDKQ